MIKFFRELAGRRIDETSKSAERENKKEASTTGNAENINVDVTFQQNLSSVFGILSKIEKNEMAEFSKKMKKRINAVEIMMENLFQYVITPPINIQFDTHIMDLARTYFDLGCIYVLKSNYLCTAIKHFERVIELLKGKEMHCKAILLAIRVRIILSECLENIQQLEKHSQMLEEAMELYIKYTNEEDEYPDPIYVTIAGDCPEEQRKDPKDLLFDFHMKTLEGLGNLYNTQYINMHKFVIHVHDILIKHLLKVISTGNKPSIFWAHALASLSDYFIFYDRFKEAKIYLAVADYVRREHKLKLKDQTYSGEEYQNYKQLHACTTRLWGMYGLKLLYLSQQRLINDKSCEANNIKSKFLTKSEEELVKPLIFLNVENKLEENFAIAHTYVSNLNDAKVVFKNVLKCFNTTRTIYDAERAFWYHIDIILQISSGYKYYTYFVGNRSEKIKLIKQQIQFLENNVNALFSKLTSDDYKDYKKLYLELAITYSMLLDMTYEEFNQIKDVTDEMKMELKQLTKNILDNYKLCLEEI